MGPARTELPLCILLLLLGSAAAGAAYPQPTELPLYGCHGSDVLIPGAGLELPGDGLLEWHVKKPGDQERQWILTYHYGTNEPEVSTKYEHRVFFSMKNASLKLLNLTRQDDGQYILEMNSSDKEDEKQVPLRVLEPISDIKVMKYKSSGEYGVRLMCEASGDVWNLTWWHKGRPLMQNITHDGNTSVLVLKEVGTGSYTCVAWNPVSELETSYQIAQQSIMILYLVGLLTAAVVFSLPYLLTQLFLCLTCSCRCPEPWVSVFQCAAFVCWFLFLICALGSTVVRLSASVSYAFPELNLVLLVVLMVCIITELFSLADWKSLKKDRKRQDYQDPTMDKRKSADEVSEAQNMDMESKKALPDPTLDKRKSADEVNGVQNMDEDSKKALPGVSSETEDPHNESPIVRTAGKVCGVLDKLLLLLRLTAFLGSWVTLLVYFIYDFCAYEKPAHFELTISLAVVVPTVLFIPICCCCWRYSRWLERPGNNGVTEERTMEMGTLLENDPGGT
ncbi:uncharacterized protein LOC144821552 isoform X2 [Lissotriton helveticus]